MFIITEVDKRVPISFVITDSNGNPVSNDTPYYIAKDLISGNYFNGITWGPAESKVYFSHFNNGEYVFHFSSKTSGEFEVKVISDAYNLMDTHRIKVIGENVPTYDWKVGAPYIAKFFPAVPVENIPNIMILRNSDNKYWSGTDWLELPTSIPMTKISEFSYMYDITFASKDRYPIQISTEEEIQLSYVVYAIESGSTEYPFMASNKTVKSPDGTDSTLMDETGIYIKGVKVTAYDAVTKEEKGSTTTNEYGAWSMKLDAGKYFFLFEKDGYTSVGVESEG